MSSEPLIHSVYDKGKPNTELIFNEIVRQGRYAGLSVTTLDDGLIVKARAIEFQDEVVLTKWSFANRSYTLALWGDETPEERRDFIQRVTDRVVFDMKKDGRSDVRVKVEEVRKGCFAVYYL